MKKNSKGFTLVELIVVIAIIGILAAVLIPSVMGYVKKAKISKGVQNARNLTSMIIGEVILNEKEYLLPNEVIQLATENGYTLKSEVEGYAYWYNTKDNTVVFESFAEAVGGVGLVNASSESQARSLVENIATSKPTYLYVDQTNNPIKRAIDSINDLYDIAVLQSGSDNIDIVLEKMDNIVTNLTLDISTIKGVSRNIIELIQEHISSFNTSDTIYVGANSVYNKRLQQLKKEGATEGDIVVIRAMVLRDVEVVDENYDYRSYDITVLAPIFIPSSVRSFDAEVLKNVVSGTVIYSKGTYIETNNINPNVVLSSIATINSVKYFNINVNPNYNIKTIRFTNGIQISIPNGAKLYIDNLTTEDGYYKMNNATLFEDGKEIKLLVVKEGESLRFYKEKIVSDKYFYMATDGEYYSNKNGTGLTPSIEENDLEYNENILSTYLVPSIEIGGAATNNLVNLTKFINSSNLLIGRITLKSTIYPMSVKFTGLAVDNDNIGYKVNNVGYITDILMNVEQTKTDEKGQKTIFGNKSAIININLPAEARDYVNLQDVEVRVEYQYVYVEFKEYTTLDGSKLMIPTGNRFSLEEKDTVNLSGNSMQGFTSSTPINIASKSYNGNACNQIKVTKVIILDAEGNELFSRNFF